jgi:hypothetical protein
MDATVTPIGPQQPSKPEPRKFRIITLTNRAPVQIVEADWAELFSGGCGDDDPDAPWGWSINIRVRKGNFFGPHFIIAAKYKAWDESSDRNDGTNQVVRVGRLLNAGQAATALAKNILEVGEELRSRILLERLRKYVTYAVDECMAELPVNKLYHEPQPLKPTA